MSTVVVQLEVCTFNCNNRIRKDKPFFFQIVGKEKQKPFGPRFFSGYLVPFTFGSKQENYLLKCHC